MNKNTVTQAQIEGIIENSTFEVFHRVHEKQCLVAAKLPNGFTLVGESACVDPLNYDERIGFDLAVKQIQSRLWELEGYTLQNKLYFEQDLDIVREQDIADVSTALLPCDSFILQPGHIRYTANTYVGEHSKDVTLEGVVDDVLKVLAKLD